VDDAHSELMSLPVPYDIEVTVKSGQGRCDYGHKIGDRIYFDGKSNRGNICYTALMALLPKVHAMRFGAESPWAGDSMSSACSGADNRTVFEMKRIRKGAE